MKYLSNIIQVANPKKSEYVQHLKLRSTIVEAFLFSSFDQILTSNFTWQYSEV